MLARNPIIISELIWNTTLQNKHSLHCRTKSCLLFITNYTAFVFSLCYKLFVLCLSTVEINAVKWKNMYDFEYTCHGLFLKIIGSHSQCESTKKNFETNCLQVNDNDWFFIWILCWTLSIVSGPGFDPNLCR